MRRVAIPFSFALLFSFIAVAQKPGWVDNYWRSQEYPSSDYFTGFISKSFKEGTEPESLKSDVIALSRQKLSESIQALVKTRSAFGAGSLSETSIEVLNEIYITKSSLDKIGLVTDTYIDDYNKVAYGFSYVGKRKLQAGYYQLFSALVKDIQGQISIVKQESDLDRKFEGYKTISKDMNRAKGMRDMLVALGIRNDVVLMTNDWKSINYDLESGMAAIRFSEDLTLDQSIMFFVEGMNEELNESQRVLKINPVTYENSGVPTQFSEYFKDRLIRAMEGKFELVEDPDAKYKLTGSYWVSGDKVRVTMNIHEYDGGERIFLVHGGALILSKVLIEGLGLPYEIDPSVDLQKHFKILSSGEMDGGIKAEIKTQKGDESLVFKEGEQLKLIVNVSRPAYIRLINIWSDGKQLSLLENYFIPESEVNQDIELPFDWETACPCGIEYIKLIAQNKPFQEIELISKDGMDYIETDITTIMENTRRVQESLTKETELFFGEDGFSITTME